MDPFTLFVAATALYNGIKSAVDTGQDIMETAEKVGGLFAKVAEITQIASAPRRKKLFQSQGEFEAEAMKLYAVKAKAHQMSLDVKNMFVSQYGKAAWDAIQREVIEMRKDAARESAADQAERNATRDDALMIGSIVSIILVVIGLIGSALILTSK